MELGKDVPHGFFAEMRMQREAEDLSARSLSLRQAACADRDAPSVARLRVDCLRVVNRRRNSARDQGRKQFIATRRTNDVLVKSVLDPRADRRRREPAARQPNCIKRSERPAAPRSIICCRRRHTCRRPS